MMTTTETIKHTPGPWRTVNDGGRVRIFGPRLSERGWNGVTVVANINGHFAKPDTSLRAEHEANARLITAAPGMLLALQAVYARFKDDNTLASAEWCKHEIAAAIRAATEEERA